MRCRCPDWNDQAPSCRHQQASLRSRAARSPRWRVGLMHRPQQPLRACRWVPCSSKIPVKSSTAVTFARLIGHPIYEGAVADVAAVLLRSRK
jgi:hypothetical protein